MSKHEATELAKQAIKSVTVGNPISVAEATVLVRNTDGTYSVCDNGEEAVAQSESEAIEFIVENLS